MMEALTLRGLQDTDTIMPENGKSETEDGNLAKIMMEALTLRHQA